MGFLWITLLACAPRQPQGIRAPELEQITYDLRLDATFVTRGEDGLELSVADQSLSLVGQAVLTEAALYRDGSLGTVVVFHDLLDAASGDAHGLSGRAMELRTFASGEVLEVRGLDHLAGPERHGDALDVLIPLLSPRLPVGGGGDGPISLATSYPVHVAEGRGHKVELATEWAPSRGRPGAVRQYEGQLRCSGRELSVSVSCAGAVSGSTEQDRSGQLEAHALQWSRTLVLQGPGGRLVQEQVFEGEIRRRSEGGS